MGGAVWASGDLLMGSAAGSPAGSGSRLSISCGGLSEGSRRRSPLLLRLLDAVQLCHRLPLKAVVGELLLQ